MNNQDVFSACLQDIAESLQLVEELEHELTDANPPDTSGDPKRDRTLPRAWAA